jgi:hypothetical protein
MPRMRRWLAIAVLLAVSASSSAAIDWPMDPPNVSHSIGNSYGEYQNYGSGPYFHPGIDILSPPGTPVYAVKAGYVKAVLTTSADLHWRVAIGDSAGAATCDGWLYAHLDQATIAVNVGDTVAAGQYLGNLVHWPIADFHHLHFVKIRNSGVTWNSDWQFIGNALDELSVIDDTTAPIFQPALDSALFAFCQNEEVSYFAPGEPLAGDVDIICRAGDRINSTWLVAPYKLEYRIDGDSSIPWTTSVVFTGFLDWNHNVNVIYQNDGYLVSQGDYSNRIFYFNLTNTDGDGIIEASDKPRSWQTGYFHNGDYTVYARAADRYGNSTIVSMPVTVYNLFVLSGVIDYSDGNPDNTGALVTVLSDNLADTTDSGGDYAIPAVGGGTQLIEFSRRGYETLDTTVMMNQHRQVNVILQPAPYVLGDANFDGTVNIGDPVYIVNYIFKGGPVPVPYAAGDANSDGSLNIGDAVFLINYIFHGGPPPGK